MIRAQAGLAGLLLASLAAAAPVQFLPAQNAGLAPGRLAVIDEHGRAGDMADLLPGPGPVLLLPVFTQCAAACPLMAANLRTSLAPRAGAPAFRVVVLSFDAGDTDQALRRFRSDLDLPADWTLARAARAGDARAFLDRYGYAVMRSNSGFIHPDEVFVLSARGRWSGTLAGDSFPPETLAAAARGARALEEPSALASFRRGAADPQNWAVWGVAVLLAAASAAMAAAVRRSPR